MKRRIYVTLFVLISFLTASCALTLQDRIDLNPEVFDSLQTWEKEKVVRGEVAVGMSPEAVKIAWGEPQNIVSGNAKGKFSQHWIYSVNRSVPSPYYYPYWGGYYGHHHRHYYYAPYYGTDIVSVEIAYVIFEENKVVAWEQKK